MIDAFVDVGTVRRLYATAEEFGLPVESVGVTKEGYAIPTRPLMYFGVSGYALQFVNPMDPDHGGLFDCVSEPWQKLTAGVNHLTSPNTSSRRLTGDIIGVAGDVFTAGLKISETLPDVGIVLPPYVGFKPDATAIKSLQGKGVDFKYNLWRPGPVDVRRYVNDASQKIETLDFILMLRAPLEGSKMREFSVTSNTVLSGFKSSAKD